MMTEHLQRVVNRLSTLSAEEQEAYAAWLEADLTMDEQERRRIATQLDDPSETDLEKLLARADQQSSEGQVYDLDSIL